MSTRVTTTILLILLVLVSAASGIYHLKSRQEAEPLQQRIPEPAREQSLPPALKAREPGVSGVSPNVRVWRSVAQERSGRESRHPENSL